MVYAYAAITEGAGYVNFTPSLGASFPAALELAELRKTVTCGKDGKTGETLMKTVLAPMFALRNFRTGRGSICRGAVMSRQTA